MKQKMDEVEAFGWIWFDRSIVIIKMPQVRQKTQLQQVVIFYLSLSLCFLPRTHSHPPMHTLSLSLSLDEELVFQTKTDSCGGQV